jgi:hypothetical protein
MQGTYKAHLIPIKKRTIDLMAGDVIERGDIGQVIFERFKRGNKSFVAQARGNGLHYTCRLGFKGLDKEIEVVGRFEAEEIQDDRNKLKYGDLFMFEKNGRWIVIRFKKKGRNDKIEGEDPIDSTKGVTITGFTVVKIEDHLKK